MYLQYILSTGKFILNFPLKKSEKRKQWHKYAHAFFKLFVFKENSSMNVQ